MITPMPMFNIGGGLPPKSYLSMLIMANLLLLISLCIAIYLFMQDNYLGNFWEWSWDENYGVDSNSGLACIYFWIPFFTIDGIAIFLWGSKKIESLIERWSK